MAPLTWITLLALLGGVLSVLAASLFLLLGERLRANLLPHLVSFATGALLGAAFLALLPHALEGSPDPDPHSIGLTVLIGLLLFFVLEKMVLWRHCHEDHCEVHDPDAAHRRAPAGILILVGDGIHNFVDGVLIAAAFLSDLHLGVITGLAVAAHEIPQELGDFAILLHSGYSRLRALVLNVLSSLTTVFGAWLAYYGLQRIEHVLPYVLALAASSFVYIAVADLIPGLHRRVQLQETVQQVSLIALGAAVIYVAHSTLH